MSLCCNCCRWCVSFNFSLGLTALFLWLALRTSKPSLSIVDFHVPALNKTAHANLTSRIPPEDTSIAFDLKLENTNKDAGIYYDALNLTFYFGPDQSPVGNASFDPFYQGHKKTAHRRGSVPAQGGAFWEDILRAVSEGRQSQAFIKVRLVTAVRYKILFWKTRHHGLNLTGDVAVNDQGTKSAKRVKLRSVAPAHGGYRPLWVVFGAGVGVLVLLG